MLTIDWPKSESSGYVDYIDVGIFSRIGRKRKYRYNIIGPKRTVYSAICHVDVREGVADFDYEGDNEQENKNNQIDIGVMRIKLAGKIPEKVLWKEKGKADFKNVGAVFALQDDDAALLEGKRKLVTHIRSERKPVLAQRKIHEALAAGSLECEACGVDLKSIYGTKAVFAFEVHHRRPLASGEQHTSLSKLAILCANCHRVLHATGLRSVESFRSAIIVTPAMR